MSIFIYKHIKGIYFQMTFELSILFGIYDEIVIG